MYESMQILRNFKHTHLACLQSVKWQTMQMMTYCLCFRYLPKQPGMGA